MTTTKTTVSLASLDARKAGEEPFEFEYLDGEGNRTGVFLSVLGAHCETVTAAINQAVNDRRRKEAIAEAKSRVARPGSAEFTPVEDDVLFGQRLAAVRLVGWRGITEEFTPALALRLCQSNPDLSQQVLEASNTLGNFMKVSSPIS